MTTAPPGQHWNAIGLKRIEQQRRHLLDTDACEVAHDHTAHATQLAGQAQVGQETIHAVQRLVDVLDEQHDVIARQLVRRSQRGTDHRQVAAHQSPSSLARQYRGQRPRWRMPQQVPCPQLAAQHLPQRRLGRRLLLRQQIGFEQRPMEGHEPGMASDGHMQRGDIAVAHEGFGMARQQSEVDLVQQTGRAVATTQAENGIHFRIGKRVVEVLQAGLVATGQIALR